VTTFRLDLDVASAGSTGTRLHVGYALRDTRVAALVARDGAPVEMLTLDVGRWQDELESRLRVPGPADPPRAPARVLELPWDLLVGTGAALVRRRHDVYDELVARDAGSVRAIGTVLDLTGTHEQLRRVHHGVLARLQAVGYGSGRGRPRIGWTSWLLFGDGWRELTPYAGSLPGGGRRAMVRVEPRCPADLAAQVARWAVEVRT
jgi:hypothetical protein